MLELICIVLFASLALVVACLQIAPFRDPTRRVVKAAFYGTGLLLAVGVTMLTALLTGAVHKVAPASRA